MVFDLNLPFFDETHLFLEQILYSMLDNYLPFLFEMDFQMFDMSTSYSYLDADDEEEIDDFLDLNENAKESKIFSEVHTYSGEIFDSNFFFNKFVFSLSTEFFESVAFSGTLIFTLN